MSDKSLTEKTLSGINWSLINNYSNAIITTIVGIILARLLTPKDFGLVGMVLLFTGIADLFASLGMGQSIIRLKDFNEKHIKTATTITFLSSVLILLIFYFLSPFIANFYHEPKLILLIRVLAILFPIKGISTVSYSRLQKELNFKYIMKINIYNSILYGVSSSIFALSNFGEWSLVYGKLIATIFATFLTIKKYPVNINFNIYKTEFKELAGFGSGVSISNLLLYASSNIDFLIIGKYLNAFYLGLYTKAFNLMTQTISKVTGGLYNVMFPAFAEAQNQPEKLRKAYIRTVQTVTYFVFPILMFMVINSDFVIIGLYGEKWTGSIQTFQILAIGGIFNSTLPFSGAIAHATGKVYFEVLQQLMYFLALSLGVIFGIKFGIEGVAAAVVFALVLMFIAQSWLAIKIIQTTWFVFFKALFPSLINILFIIIINYALRFLFVTYLNNILYEIKLLILVIFNIVSFIPIIIFIPKFIKDDTIEWLVGKYEKKMPPTIVKIYYNIKN